MQESGSLLAPSSAPSPAAPSSGPAAAIVGAADISPDNLSSAEAGMDEPADYNIPDTPDPAGQSDKVQDPTTVGQPVNLNPSFGEGNADDDALGR